ncbi:hypothetical protein SAMN05661096_01713 [Marivirga sericea]|uniref:Uncharacterized protein n=1 Tax=Marivirga sericea TaxID=1028 RepID=A0A1X7JL70_9BACT|nr:hypothetical protein [Marivirga sericea]SMG28561.1 hypothetical protein SAMN05661096_01713 [Marivirga sericea]
MKSSYLYFFIVLFSVSMLACEDENSDDCDFESKICTEEFKSVTLEIKDMDGNPVVLDDFYTFLDSRQKYEFQLNDPQEGRGIYPVITDSEIPELESEGTVFIFVGEINGKNVVEHQMVIGHDCCHVQLLEGADKILID